MPSEEGQLINYSVDINVPISMVWDVITKPELVKLWLSDTEIDVFSDQKAGGTITFQGKMHGKTYTDTGVILRFEPESILEYTYLSSFSRLPYNSENYSIVKFELAPLETGTILKLQQSGFKARASYEHANFYWLVTLQVLKRTIENLFINSR